MDDIVSMWTKVLTLITEYKLARDKGNLYIGVDDTTIFKFLIKQLYSTD